MNIKSFVAGIATGVAATIIVYEVLNKVAPFKSADDILNNIKNDFKKQGDIDGSWIYMKIENFTNGITQIPVYRGGISRTVDGIQEAYEFAADARTGTIVDLRQANIATN